MLEKHFEQVGSFLRSKVLKNARKAYELEHFRQKI